MACEVEAPWDLALDGPGQGFFDQSDQRADRQPDIEYPGVHSPAFLFCVCFEH